MTQQIVNADEHAALEQFIHENIPYNDRLDVDSDGEDVSVLENALFVIKQLHTDREMLRRRFTNETKRAELIRQMWVQFAAQQADMHPDEMAEIVRRKVENTLRHMDDHVAALTK
jgi:hypothetical protein